MNMQTKNAAFELKREPDEDGSFEGYASVFDVVDLAWTLWLRARLPSRWALGGALKCSGNILCPTLSACLMRSGKMSGGCSFGAGCSRTCRKAAKQWPFARRRY